MGELAAAIAHELNQPLMAAGTYTRLVDDAIRSKSFDIGAVAETAQKAVAQVERAAEVMRRLRALVRLDRTGRVSSNLERIVRETIALCQPDLDRGHVGTRVVLAADLPNVFVDVLQIQQVLLNLLRNSIEAIGEARPAKRSISVEASVAGPNFVEVRVNDTGPGFPQDLLDNPFLPFSSTKAEGLGFGLPLCKSIVEAHSGHLRLEGDARGGVVCFTIPTARESNG